VSDETGSGSSQLDNSVRHGGSKPRETEQERTKTPSQPDGNQRQQWQLYRRHVGLMRRAFAYAKKTPQYDSHHSRKSHDSPLTVDQRQRIFSHSIIEQLRRVKQQQLNEVLQQQKAEAASFCRQRSKLDVEGANHGRAGLPYKPKRV
jgi:hypothetical protein